MPVVRIELLKGRDAGTKHKIAKAIAEVFAANTGVAMNDTTVIFTDIDHDDWTVGGTPYPRPPGRSAD